MNLPLTTFPSATRSRSRVLSSSLRRLQDHLMLNVYGGISSEDLERYSNEPDTLAGLIATRTGRSRRTVRAWLSTVMAPWHRA